ncbi:MAG: AI-2E family transporter [Gemmatimonadaceae bacterium]
MTRATRPHDRVALPRPPSAPTAIYISPRKWTLLLLAGAAAVLLLLWKAPSVLTLSIGGVALAIVLSFPVGMLSRVMPRGAAIALSFLLVGGLLAAIVVGVVPVLVEQLSALVEATPGIARRIGERIPRLLDRLAARGLLPSAPDQFLENMQRDLLNAVQSFAGRMVGQLGRVITRALNVAVTLFGVILIAAYLLADARTIHAAALRAAPKRYRRDVRDLWNAFRFTLSRYLSGLAASLAIQGVISGVALYFLGVPYAALLGAWVSVTALIPYLGAWIGAIPAILVAFSESPMTALFTAVLFLVIQQLEGNVLTPRIQGQAVKVHPVIVFLAVIAGGEIAGIGGIVFAVPALAVLRVLFDFFRVRIRVSDDVSPVVPMAGGRALPLARGNE